MAAIACVDLGTNTCLMLVAQKAGDHVQVLADRASIVRLGEGVDRTRTLTEAAQQRTLACLRTYAEEARKLGATQLHLMATSAMRDARNAPEFALRMEAETGFSVRIITGDEEAELTWEGAVHDFAQPGKPLAVFDVGGGSTEVMVGEGAVLQQRVSVDVGSVRLTERLLRSDPPTSDELARCEAEVRRALHHAPDLLEGTQLVGIAGTVTTLAACAQARDHFDGAAMHGQTLSLADVVTLKERLAALRAADRLSIRPLEPGRADVIVAGAIIVEAVMRRYGLAQLTVGDRGLRWGMFLRLAG